MSRQKESAIATIFCRGCAEMCRDLEAEGLATIIPVAEFPEGAPRVNDKGRRAFFAVRCSPELLAVIKRLHDREDRRGAA